MRRVREFSRPLGRLRIDGAAVEECRELAAEIASPIEDLARRRTTVSIERASLRLLGGDGADTLLAGEGEDTLDGGAGRDRAVLRPY